MRTLTNAVKKSGSDKIPDEWLTDINRRSALYAKHMGKIISDYHTDNGLSGDINLSVREASVLTDLSSGLSRSEIAVGANLSINTVKTVINMIYLKLDAQNTADAVRIALERKLI
jgi:DNA-binding CsgD family transcriptional regulator